jgi:hypothetical protein
MNFVMDVIPFESTPLNRTFQFPTNGNTKMGDKRTCEVGSADPGGRAGLRRRFAAARLLGLRVRIPLRTWMFIFCVILCR